MNFNTSLLHGSNRCDPATGATLTPIYQVSAFAQESAEQLEKVFNKISAGVYEDTIRISVGIEDIEDLTEDFRQAIENL